MFFVVQDDNGSILNANAYISVAQFKEYHSARGNPIRHLSALEIQQAIVRATDYLDQRFNYVGEKTRREQETQWPREDAYDSDDNPVYGIPFEVVRATSDYALIASQMQINPTPIREDNGRIVSQRFEKVGPLEERTVYEGSVRFEMPRYPIADNILQRRGLVRRGSRIRRA